METQEKTKRFQKFKESKFVKTAKTKVVPVLAKFPNQTHVSVLRDGFGLMLPITIIGAVSTLIVVIVFGGWGGTSTSLVGLIAKASGQVIMNDNGTTWEFIPGSVYQTISEVGINIFAPLKAATIDNVTIYTAFLLPYMLAKKRNAKDPMLVALVGLVAYFLVVHREPFFFEANGTLSAMVISSITAELFMWIMESGKFNFKMKNKFLPEAITKGFDIMIPALMTLVAVAVLDGISWAIGKYGDINILENVYNAETGGIEQKVKFVAGTYGFGALFFNFVTSPMFSIIGAQGTSGLGIALFYVFAIGVFWIFGLHGSNMVNIAFMPFLLAGVYSNLKLREQGVPLDSPLYQLFNVGTYDSFIIITGWGITGALVLGVLIFGNIYLPEKPVAKMAAVPQIFNINEPVTFGFPLMMNIKWALPCIITMPAATIVTYFAYQWHLVNPTFLNLPWTLPLGINGLLSTGLDWRAFVLAWFNFGIAFCIYLPFIFLYNKMAINKLKKTGQWEIAKAEADAIKAEQTRIKLERKALKQQQG